MRGGGGALASLPSANEVPGRPVGSLEPPAPVACDTQAWLQGPALMPPLLLALGVSGASLPAFATTSEEMGVIERALMVRCEEVLRVTA